MSEEMVTSVTLELSYPSRALKELFSEQLLLQHPIISLLSGLHTDGVAGEEKQENNSRSKYKLDSCLARERSPMKIRKRTETI